MAEHESRPILLTQGDVNKMVLSHDRDIRAVKAIIGFLVIVGGGILALVSILTGYFHK